MSWFLLFSAIILEILATVQLKLSLGFTRFDHTLSTVMLFSLSLICAAFAFKKIDIGLAYALWSGLGTVGIVAIGILYFNEPSSIIKIFFACLIVVGVVGINYYS
ncbi:MAG: multidrug efflux SMR transporter [Cyanobacteria bacterium]|nr:multidrug efflux SMR transporter [Cyanobacteriota bacterium]MDA1020632.1 multidrug efflux SMR transporter [Cyanobacteriota bacterium]